MIIPARQDKTRSYELEKQSCVRTLDYGYINDNRKYIKMVELVNIISGSGLRLKGRTILDFGCGSGGFAFLLAEKVGRSGEVIGYDKQEAVINICNKKLTALGESKSENIFAGKLVESISDTFWGEDDFYAFNKKEKIGKMSFISECKKRYDEIDADIVVAKYVLNTYTSHLRRPTGFSTHKTLLNQLERNTKKKGLIVLIDSLRNVPQSPRDLIRSGYKSLKLKGEIIFWKKNN